MEPRFSAIFVVGVLGAMLGSFLNVWIHRLPRGESIVFPRSRCPSCGALIRWYDNVPIISFFWLRGRCRDCRAPISLQYPLVEAAFALLTVAVFLLAGPGLDFPVNLCLIFVLTGIAITDLRTYTIPDLFSLGGLAAGLALSFLPGGIAPLQSLAGLLIGGGSLYLVALAGEWIFKKEAMGGGDVKMLAMIGAFLGWPGVLFTLFVGSLAGSLVYGTVNYIFRIKKLVPLGLFLALGAGVYVFAGQRIIHWYLSFFRL